MTAVANDTAQMFRSIRAARSWLRRAADGAGVPGCVTMKPGNGDPPLFFIPGAAGSVLQLAPIAGSIPIAAPVYAIKPRGLAPGETPCRDLAEMAAHAIAVMTAVWRDGPYFIAGYSAGGLVALEIARRLAAADRPVPLLILLDTYPSRKVWPLRCHGEVLARQAARAIWSLRRQPPADAARDAGRRIRSLARYLAASGVRPFTPPPLVAEGADAAARRVHRATYEAGEAYRPAPYAGKVMFLQPEWVPNLEPRAPQLVWGRFLSDLTIRRVPGSHLGMLDEGAAAAASEIARGLTESRGW